jgi:diguanylate cyclase (GGDEF)-like protein
MTPPPSNDQLLAIVRTQTELAATRLGPGPAMNLIAERARQLTRATAATIELAEGDSMVFKFVCGEATPYLGYRTAMDDTLAGRCVREETAQRSDDTATDRRVDGEACRRADANSVLCMPLMQDGKAVGALKVYSSETHNFDDRDLEALELLAEVIAAQMSKRSLRDVQVHDSRHDSLTGLLNRRAYEERLAIETARANRYDQPLSLCLLDLDGFRAINDLLGHQAGDEVLRRVAAAIDESRLADDAFRLGGDEFAILMPQTSLEDASVAAARIAAAIDCVETSGAGVGVSVGVAQAGPDPAVLHSDADRRLLSAKNDLQRRDRRV